MNFDDALKHYLPRVWFRFKFLKYKYLKRGEPELWLIRHLVEPGTTALDVGASIGIYAAEMARYAGKVIVTFRFTLRHSQLFSLVLAT